ncbi:cyanophycinase [Leptolyngbya sp. NIES-3755]|nr:cyanophycinase [Leptolyngbya sp. NIES-3755]
MVSQIDTQSQDSVALPETHGELVIIGGAEDKEGDCRILREFIRRSGGLQSRIVVMTVATGLPGEVGEQYIGIFQRLGAEDVRVVDTAHREDASDPKAIEDISQATGIFFTGGNQARITECIKDTELDAALHKRFAEGAVIAGTSAGAAMMPDMMIVVGEGETNPRREVAQMDRGMGFLPNVIIDQHFAQRGRLGRLLSALAQQPASLGFGIDENTAIVVNGKIVEVVGDGAVTIVDESTVTHNNINDLLQDEALALCGAKLHILPHGYKFDLEQRSPILD